MDSSDTHPREPTSAPGGLMAAVRRALTAACFVNTSLRAQDEEFVRALTEAGYQVVPVKLTDEMEDAIAIAWHKIVENKELRAPIHWMQACHSAMLSAVK